MKVNNMETLDPIPVGIPFEEVQRKLRIDDEAPIRRLIDAVTPLLHPKAVYKVSFIEEKRDDSVVIEGVSFKSRVLRKNLDPVERVFPFSLTLGSALDQKMEATEDFLQKYYLDVVANIALREARKFLQSHLCKKFGIVGLSYMAPGSLTDWDIEAQKPLFSLLEGVGKAIGVRLTDSLLMIPMKSISGIFFPTEVSFFSCQLCPRDPCEGRKAAYSKELAREYGIEGVNLHDLGNAGAGLQNEALKNPIG